MAHRDGRVFRLTVLLPTTAHVAACVACAHPHDLIRKLWPWHSRRRNFGVVNSDSDSELGSESTCSVAGRALPTAGNDSTQLLDSTASLQNIASNTQLVWNAFPAKLWRVLRLISSVMALSTKIPCKARLSNGCMMRHRWVRYWLPEGSIQEA